MSRSGSHVMYSCHHNSSCFTFPIFVHLWHFSVFHSWFKKEDRELPKTENWPGCDNTVINPELIGGRIPLQDKYCHKTEPLWEYVEWGEKDNARKPGLSSLPETAMSYAPLCQTRGMKLLRLSVTFNHWLSPWHDMNEISGRRRRVLDFLLKWSISENSLFKG